MRTTERQKSFRRGKTPLLRAFLRREDGNLTIFALCMFTLMVMMGGIAVDLMRYETTRTTLQNTLDRATLASASLSQRLDAEAVVTDYFDKAGMSQYLRAVSVDEGMNYRQVTADARAATDPFFLHMIGIDEMDAPGHSMAEQRMTNVEVMLVLDISGSMTTVSSNGLTRLQNLKNAANEFVDTVLSSDEEDRISIGIVPFNGQVNLNAALRAQYNVTNIPVINGVTGVSGVNCVDLPAGVYGSAALSSTTAMPMTAHADTYSTTTRNSSYYSRTDSSRGTPNAANRWCPPSTTNTVMLPSNDIGALQAKINGLSAIGATSINAGMKWGLAMLDPGTQPIFAASATAGQMSGVFSDRPFDYTDPETMKIIVLMTDGEHFAEERVVDAYKTGISTVFKSPIDGNYSIRFVSGRPGVAGTNQYWVPHRSEWRALPWTDTSNTGAATLVNNPMRWEELWSEVRVQWAVWQLFARAIGTNDSQRATQWGIWLPQIVTQTPTGTMDTQLQTMCGMAKQNGVTVYGIAFEAPVGGQTQISQCSTSSAHYFNASGLQISTSFRAIANNISHLRLTQ